jgi:hypothetical protein
VEWIVDGDHYMIRLNHLLHDDPNVFRFDAGQNETPAGTYGGKVKGLYETNGDTLIVCYDLSGRQYPKSFEAKRGSRQVPTNFGESDTSTLGILY